MTLRFFEFFCCALRITNWPNSRPISHKLRIVFFDNIARHYSLVLIYFNFTYISYSKSSQPPIQSEFKAAVVALQIPISVENAQQTRYNRKPPGHRSVR